VAWWAGLFLTALRNGAADPQRPWRWGLGVTLGFPAGLMLVVLLGRESYLLWLLSIYGAVVIAATSAFPGAYVGAVRAHSKGSRPG